MRKRPLTIEEHRRLGRQLADAFAALQAAHVELANRYGKAFRLSRRAAAAEAAVDAMRSAADDQASRDLGDAFDPRLYYPGPPGAAAASDDAGRPTGRPGTGTATGGPVPARDGGPPVSTPAVNILGRRLTVIVECPLAASAEQVAGFTGRLVTDCRDAVRPGAVVVADAVHGDGRPAVCLGIEGTDFASLARAVPVIAATTATFWDRAPSARPEGA